MAHEVRIGRWRRKRLKNNREARNKNWEKDSKEKISKSNENLTGLLTRSDSGLIYIRKMALSYGYMQCELTSIHNFQSLFCQNVTDFYTPGSRRNNFLKFTITNLPSAVMTVLYIVQGLRH